MNVTMQLPIYNEKYVVSRLINSVCELDWPRDKLEIMVLDDSTDETSGIIEREIALKKTEGFDIKVIRRKERLGYKAGALQNALDQTKNEYIAIIDADFIPPRDFLERTVSAIQIDPGIGFVQARWGHINRGYNRYTEAFAIAIDGYHIVEQSARSSTGLIMNFNGSAGLLRTQAIRESGGWSWDTLSEDMDLATAYRCVDGAHSILETYLSQVNYLQLLQHFESSRDDGLGVASNAPESYCPSLEK